MTKRGEDKKTTIFELMVEKRNLIDNFLVLEGVFNVH